MATAQASRQAVPDDAVERRAGGRWRVDRGLTRGARAAVRRLLVSALRLRPGARAPGGGGPRPHAGVLRDADREGLRQSRRPVARPLPLLSADGVQALP